MTVECHNLAEKDGVTRFAYADDIVPWHRLGQPVAKGQTDLETMLRASNTDNEVSLTRVIATTPDGQPLQQNGEWVYVDNSRATLSTDRDGYMFGLSTVGLRYTVMQNRRTAEIAEMIVGADEGQAVWDTMGALDEGRQFFATLRLEDVVIDPLGVNDRIARYLNVRNSHDSTFTVWFGQGDIRMLCRNTVQAATKQADKVYKARHTRNGVIFTPDDARVVLGLSTAWNEALKAEAEALQQIELTDNQFFAIVKDVFPIKDDASDRVKANNAAITSKIKALYEGPTNAQALGHTGWAATQAITEYLDHYWDTAAEKKTNNPDQRAKLSMDDGSWVSKTKRKATARVLALV